MSRDPMDRRRKDIRDEIDFHLQERARELETEGADPERARQGAVAAFGDPERVAEQVERVGNDPVGVGRAGLFTDLIQDFPQALRGLRRNPVFAVAAGATLALAIGANAAIFGIVDAVFLQAPPVRDPAALVTVYTTCRAGDPRCASSYPDYLDYREASALEDLAAIAPETVSAAEPGQSPRLLDAMMVSGNYFRLLGVPAAVGRALQPADDDPKSPSAVAVLTHENWTESYAADPAVVGRTLRLNGVPFEIVGVAPEGFRGTSLSDDPDLFIPLTSRNLLAVWIVGGVPIWEIRDTRWIDRLVGRLAPDATLERLQAEMDGVSARLEQADAAARGGRRVTVDPSSRYALPSLGREDLTRLMSVLSGVVGLTLLLAAANVANLLLARTGARQKEMGVRLALGARSGRLVRQLLVESVVLAVVGGITGLAVALGLLRLLSVFELPGGVPLGLLDIGINGRVFAFLLGLSTLTGVAFGIVPALRAARRDPSESIRTGAQLPGRESDRLRKVLITAQTCACLVLLTGAGLFLRGLRSGLTHDIGVRAEGLALARFDFSLLDYMSPEEGMARVDRILERVERLPGVSSAAVTTTVPLQAGRNMGFFVTVDGYEPAPNEQIRVEMAFVSEDFFRTLGTSLVAGREADAALTPEDELQVVVNQQMAESYWPDGRAIGGTVNINLGPLRVVGVTENVAWRALPQPPLNFLLVPIRQAPQFATNASLTLAVRTSGDAEALLDPIRRVVLEVDPNLAFSFVQTMEDVLGARLSPQRMGTLLFISFGLLALVLAAVGIGGVVAYLVGRQKREIGIRMALGASRGQVQMRALQSMVVPVVGGAAAGLIIAWATSRWVQSFLLEADSKDPWTYAAATVLLVLIAWGAAWIPARAAARVDPVRVLKAE